MGAPSGAKKERDRVMSMVVHHTERNCRARDLAENIAKRRRYSVAVTSKPSH
jgi:hypothetical protein